MKRLLGVAIPFVVAGVVACYGAPTTTPAVDLKIPAGTYRADGVTTIVLTIEVNAIFASEETVVVEASSGILSPSADPTSSAARRVELTTKGQHTFSVPFRVGVEPTTVVFQVKAGDTTIVKELLLQARPPAVLTLAADRTAVVADGISQVTVNGSLVADDPAARVSSGTPVYFAACCIAAGVPANCLAAPPVAVPPSATSDATGHVVVHAIPFRMPASDAGLPRVAVVAGLAPAPACNATSPAISFDLVAP